MAEHAVAAQSRTRQPVDMIVAGIVLLINIVNSVDTVQASYLSCNRIILPGSTSRDHMVKTQIFSLIAT